MKITICLLIGNAIATLIALIFMFLMKIDIRLIIVVCIGILGTIYSIMDLKIKIEDLRLKGIKQL